MHPPAPASLPGRLTEKEARRIGLAALELNHLRRARDAGIQNGRLELRTRKGTAGFLLSEEEAEAVVALLVERHALFLINYDVDLEESPR